MQLDRGRKDRPAVCQAPFDCPPDVQDQRADGPLPSGSPLAADRKTAASLCPAKGQEPGVCGLPFSRRPGLLLLLAFLAAGGLATAVDCPLARWLAAGACPEILREMLEVCEPFGNGLMVVLIAAGLFFLDRRKRWALPRLLAGPLLAGLVANLVKMSIMRLRPRHFDLASDVWASFGHWLPLTGAGSAGQSFPSGHAATAFGLATVLAWLYPRGRWFFFSLAVLVAVQRMACGAHFLSDVLVGAGLGVGLGILFTRKRRWIGWLDRWQELPAAAGRWVLRGRGQA